MKVVPDSSFKCFFIQGNLYTGEGDLPLVQSVNRKKLAVSAKQAILFYFWNNQAQLFVLHLKILVSLFFRSALKSTSSSDEVLLATEAVEKLNLSLDPAKDLLEWKETIFDIIRNIKGWLIFKYVFVKKRTLWIMTLWKKNRLIL